MLATRDRVWRVIATPLVDLVTVADTQPKGQGSIGPDEYEPRLDGRGAGGADLGMAAAE